jgi:hypothetical protein
VRSLKLEGRAGAAISAFSILRLPLIEKQIPQVVENCEKWNEPKAALETAASKAGSKGSGGFRRRYEFKNSTSSKGHGVSIPSLGPVGEDGAVGNPRVRE